jgi:hypothetical protein
MILGVLAGITARPVPGLHGLSHSHAHEQGHEAEPWHLVVDAGCPDHHEDEPHGPDCPDDHHHHHPCIGGCSPLIAQSIKGWSVRVVVCPLFGGWEGSRPVPEEPVYELDTPPLI